MPKDGGSGYGSLLASFAHKIEEMWGIHMKLDDIRERMQNLDEAGSGGDAGDDEDLGGEEDAGEMCTTGVPAFPPTSLVLRLSPTIRPEAAAWLVTKIRGRKRDGGAELLVRREPSNDHSKGIVLHVAASRIKLLEAAEALELRKRDQHGRLREVTVADLDSFITSDSGSLDALLTTADKQMIVAHEMDNMRACSHENHIPGYPKAELYDGQPILAVYQKEELIEQMYPLHDQETLKRFAPKWYWALFQSQPFEEIRAYFGDAVAMYFHFLGFYAAALVVPTVFGMFFWLVAPETPHLLSIFCIINLIWATIFLEMWKRYCNEVAYAWGTLTLTRWEEPRPNYHGPKGRDPVTGRIQPIYPMWKTALKVYCVSLPVLLVLLYLTFRVMIVFLNLEESLVEQRARSGSQLAGILAYLPSVGYTVFVLLANMGYVWLADLLTEWENHKTQRRFDNHRIVKLVAFEFLNTFMSLFYIAFYLQDIDQLRSQLLTMLIVYAAINHFQEAVFPFVLRDTYIKGMDIVHTYANKWISQPTPLGREKKYDMDDHNDILHTLDVPTLDKDDIRIQQASIEAERDTYQSTYDDYLELFLQFGYVFLFSAACPLASLWALANNVFEIRADAYKLCRVLQRPIAKRVRDIGAWQYAFEFLGFLAVVTNSALLFVSPQVRSMAPSWTEAQWLLLFVMFEHCVISLKTAIHLLIPDVPKAVADALKRQEYLSRLAYRREQSRNSRRHLSRRFKSIHISRPHAHQHSKEDGVHFLQRPGPNKPLSSANLHPLKY